MYVFYELLLLYTLQWPHSLAWNNISLCSHPFFSSEQATEWQRTCRSCIGKFKPAGHTRGVLVTNAWLRPELHQKPVPDYCRLILSKINPLGVAGRVHRFWCSTPLSKHIAAASALSVFIFLAETECYDLVCSDCISRDDVLILAITEKMSGYPYPRL
jgi:hypothetical protein